MERRLLLAVALMFGVIVLGNLLFPPVPTERPVGPDTALVEPGAGAPGLPGAGGGREAAGPEGGRAATERAAAPEPASAEEVAGEDELEDPAGGVGEPGAAAEAAVPSDTILVESPLYRLRFDSRGAALVSAELGSYRSYAAGDADTADVQLIREGDHLFGYRVASGPDTIDLAGRPFEATADSVILGEGADSLTFRYRVGTGERGPVVFRVTYHFHAESYLIGVRGAFEGIGERGYGLSTSLGEGLRTNEASTKEDLGQLSYVARGRRGGIRSERISAVGDGEVRAAEGGPFDWVAVKNKYFLVAFLAPEGSPRFGGLLVTGVPEENAARIITTLPVPAGTPTFVFEAYLGPQDYGRLKVLGQDLQNVNPVGWRLLQPVIRPLVALVMAILTWMHTALSLAYGWVLVLFGVLTRVVLFPLYQKSMRAQMGQMRVQPLVKDLREKYKDDPQKMQQEMMRLYREHNINPLAGCLPMLLPMPILITLFFVFRQTIEFRGVPFLWLPDLSLKDPYYIVPLLMGGSMFLLQWIGQRGMESTAQMKMLGYGMPILFTFLFANFPSGLNLYYATSNVASLPQQFYIARERKKAQVPTAESDESDAGSGRTGGGRVREAEARKERAQKRRRSAKKRASAGK